MMQTYGEKQQHYRIVDEHDEFACNIAKTDFCKITDGRFLFPW